MFERLQKKWNVSGFRLAIIICIFAIGGSLTGYLGKKIMNLQSLEKGIVWVIIYILLIILIWPMAVLLVSIPFGQFRFFSNYIKRIGRRFGALPAGRQVISSESLVRSQESIVNSQKAGRSLTTPDSPLTTHHSRPDSYPDT